MALAANVIDRHGPSNKMYCQFIVTAKAVLAFYLASNEVLPVIHYPQDRVL